MELLYEAVGVSVCVRELVFVLRMCACVLNCVCACVLNCVCACVLNCACVRVLKNVRCLNAFSK